MRILDCHPATVIIREADGNVITRVSTQAGVYTDTDEPQGTFVVSMSDEAWDTVHITDITLDVPGRLEARNSDVDRTVVVRQTVPDDAMTVNLAPFPLPVKAIQQRLVAGGQMQDLYAMVDPQGDVHTVLLYTDYARWVRYGGAWIALLDLDQVSNYNSVKTDATGLALYDAADQSGQMVHISGIPNNEEPENLPTVVYLPDQGRIPTEDNPLGVTEVPTTRSEPIPGQPVTSAAASLITSGSDEEVETAIAAALADDSLRWYVERRLRSLGIEYELPWLEEEEER